jgi:Proteolysis_6 C-terminal
VQVEDSADGCVEEPPLPSPCLSDDTVTDAMRSVGLQALLREQEGVELWGAVEAAAVRWVCALDSPQLLLSMPGTSTSTASNSAGTAAAAAAATAAPCSIVMSTQSTGQAAGQGELNRSAITTATVGTGYNTQKRFSHLKSALTRKFPFPCRPALFPLPSSYTQLHSQLTAMGGYAFPALCLLCGAVLDANGRGKCATHSMICNRDAGVIFLLQVKTSTSFCTGTPPLYLPCSLLPFPYGNQLALSTSTLHLLSFLSPLQDCTVLLSIGPRCSYFPTPYVDDYGEKHKHCRGRPLHLDTKRLEILRKLWVTHGVGNEVYQKRSTSSRVVINGHY